MKPVFCMATHFSLFHAFKEKSLVVLKGFFVFMINMCESVFV